MQVRDVLAHVTKLRRRVRNKARRFQATASDDIIGSLLERLEEHDRSMHGFQAELERNSPKAVLETWIQFPDTKPIENEISDLGRKAEADDAEQFIEKLLDLDQRLLSLYHTAAEQTHAPSVQEFFRKLVDMESQKARANSWNVAQTQDARHL
ncbi:hypothetical protein [Pirellulimonas nuda]|nr:hypothetical protein [Pirellulimonas nuda]